MLKGRRLCSRFKWIFCGFTVLFFKSDAYKSSDFDPKIIRVREILKERSIPCETSLVMSTQTEAGGINYPLPGKKSEETGAQGVGDGGKEVKADLLIPKVNGFCAQACRRWWDDYRNCPGMTVLNEVLQSLTEMYKYVYMFMKEMPVSEHVQNLS